MVLYVGVWLYDVWLYSSECQTCHLNAWTESGHEIEWYSKYFFFFFKYSTSSWTLRQFYSCSGNFMLLWLCSLGVGSDCIICGPSPTTIGRDLRHYTDQKSCDWFAKWHNFVLTLFLLYFVSYCNLCLKLFGYPFRVNSRRPYCLT